MFPSLSLRFFKFCNRVVAHELKLNRDIKLRNRLLQRITSSDETFRHRNFNDVDLVQCTGAVVAQSSAFPRPGARGSSTHSRGRVRAGPQVDAENCGRASELRRGDRHPPPDFFGQ